MSARQHFILQGVRRLEVEEYLKEELKGAGFGWVDIRKTPLGTRVIIHASRPGVVIGRRGTTVRNLTETLEAHFKLENPQIEVKEISESSLNAQVMALRLSSGLQRGIKYRRAGYGSLRRIKESGALGAEIIVSGKLTSQRSRTQKFRFGTIAKTGKPSEKFVDKATTQVVLKSGVIGVQVKIMNQTDELPDKVVIPKAEPQPEAEVVQPEKHLEQVEEAKTEASLSSDADTGIQQPEVSSETEPELPIGKQASEPPEKESSQKPEKPEEESKPQEDVSTTEDNDTNANETSDTEPPQEGESSSTADTGDE
ncbi:MAG: 30S ribosomal protein S3 [Candidatus Ranarchaeia archaeon]